MRTTYRAVIHSGLGLPTKWNSCKRINNAVIRGVRVLIHRSHIPSPSFYSEFTDSNLVERSLNVVAKNGG